MSMIIYPKLEPNSITKILNKLKISQNKHAILAVVMKSGIGYYRKLLSNEMRHDVIMSKQHGQPRVFGVMYINTQSINILY